MPVDGGSEERIAEVSLGGLAARRPRGSITSVREGEDYLDLRGGPEVGPVGGVKLPSGTAGGTSNFTVSPGRTVARL
jgi:hypothetical protein